MKFIILFFLYFYISNFTLSQISITTSNYSQNFGVSNINSWLDNSTFLGWYLHAGGTFNYGGTINITTTNPTNTGGFFTYKCNNDNDIKLGSRPSNASGGSAGSGQSHIGLRFINNTGQSIESITIWYRCLQMSLAENFNGTNTYINSLKFSYQISQNITSLNSGTWINVNSLDYIAPNNSTVFDGSASSQISGYPCTEFQDLFECIDIPTLINGEEIMFRWTDINDNLNDHHLAIDNIEVFFHFSDECLITLPIELLSFKVENIIEYNNISWVTASEVNNDYFLLEESVDGINWTYLSKINGNGNSTEKIEYYYQDRNFVNNINYYRLTQVDFDGTKYNKGIISIDNRKEKVEIISIYNLLGQFVSIEFEGMKIINYSDGSIKKMF
jgi:hypothetical protein